MKAGLSHRHFPSDFFEDQSQNNVSVDWNKNSKKKLNPAESYLLSEGREQIRRNQNSGLLEPITNNKYYLSKIKEQNEQDNSCYIGNNFEKIRIRTSQGENYSSRCYYQESYTDRDKEPHLNPLYGDPNISVKRSSTNHRSRNRESMN